MKRGQILRVYRDQWVYPFNVQKIRNVEVMKEKNPVENCFWLWVYKKAVLEFLKRANASLKNQNKRDKKRNQILILE